MRRSVCVISTRSPYSSQAAREALDMALVSASCDIPTSLLLMGNGVFQLLKGQETGDIPRKNLSAMLQALPLYGVDTIHVDRTSLDERGLVVEDLLDGVTILGKKALPLFIRKHSRILNF